MLPKILDQVVRKIRQVLSARNTGVITGQAPSYPEQFPSPSETVPSAPQRAKRRRNRKARQSASIKELPVAENASSWSVEQFQVEPEPGKQRFHDFAIPDHILHGIADLGFRYCTPIQAMALADALAGKDLVGKAHTGTGKSAVFLIAIMSRILQERASYLDHKGPLALVLAPTRELVVQIVRDGQKIGKYSGLRVTAVYGGADYSGQERELREHNPTVLVATPGRLLDFLGRNIFSLGACPFLVIDEADRMLDMGFIPDVRRIISRLPDRNSRQTMLFSATISDDVHRLTSQWCTDPHFVSVEEESSEQGLLDEKFILTTKDEKLIVLCNFLLRHKDKRVLVFVNMKSEARWLGEQLARYGIRSSVLSGDVGQDKRENRLERFRAGTLNVLVATDVAGRGIHIDQIHYVINYSLPYEAADYVHRIGRTGRAGVHGVAISFACEEGSFMLPEIEEYTGRSIHCDTPDETLLAPIVPAETGVEEQSDAGEVRRRRRRKKPAHFQGKTHLSKGPAHGSEG